MALIDLRGSAVHMRVLERSRLYRFPRKVRPDAVDTHAGKSNPNEVMVVHLHNSIIT